jgi:hypothetical protein
MRTHDPTRSNLGREEDLLALEPRLLHRSAHGPHVVVRVGVVDAASTRLEPLGDGLHAARRTRQTQQVVTTMRIIVQHLVKTTHKHVCCEALFDPSGVVKEEKRCLNEQLRVRLGPLSRLWHCQQMLTNVTFERRPLQGGGGVDAALTLITGAEQSEWTEP